MDLDKSLKPFIQKKYVLPVLMIAVLIGLIAYYFYKEEVLSALTDKYLQSESLDRSTGTVQAVNDIKTMFIDIEGAVERPGVYEIETGKRINDAILLAGGFSKDVDLAYVDKNINKAQKLAEGTKIYIPKIGEHINTDSTAEKLEEDNGPISINSADKALLDTLPGIGSATADKIIAGRPYSDIGELLTRKVLNSSQYEKVKDLIVI